MYLLATATKISVGIALLKKKAITEQELSRSLERDSRGKGIVTGSPCMGEKAIEGEKKASWSQHSQERLAQTGSIRHSLFVLLSEAVLSLG